MGEGVYGRGAGTGATAYVYVALSRGDGRELRAFGMPGQVYRWGSVRAREADEGGRSPQTRTYIDSGNPTILQAL